jgi:hypothetical protein
MARSSSVVAKHEVAAKQRAHLGHAAAADRQALAIV